MRQAVLNADHDTLAEFGHDIFLEAGLLDIEILSCEGPRGVSRIHVEERVDEQQLDDLDMIQWWEHVTATESEHVYLVEMDVNDRLSREGINADGLLRAEQAEVNDYGLTFNQVGSQEQLSDMLTELKAAGFDVSLEKLQDYHVQETPLDTLTDRQKQVLEVAFESGYYDVPRNTSTTELAADFDLDDSTVSEHLQRAERNLISAVLGH